MQQDFIEFIREGNPERHFIMQPINLKHNIKLCILHQLLRKEIGSIFQIHVFNVTKI